MNNVNEPNARRAKPFSASRTAGNSVNMMATRVSELAFSLFTVVILTRYLGPENFGIFSFIFTIAFTIKNIVESGVSRIVIREVSTNKEKSSEIITAGLTINLLMGFVAMLLCVLIVFFFKMNTVAEVVALYVALLSQLALGMVNTVAYSYLAYERTRYNPLVIVSNRLLVICLIFIGIWAKCNLVYIFSAMLIGNVASLILSLVIFNYKFQKLKLSVNRSYVKNFFRESLPFTASFILIQSSLSLNIFLLKFYNFIAEIAFYQVSNRLVNAVSTVPTSIFMVMLPYLTQTADDKSHDTLRSAYSRILKYIYSSILPFCLICTFFSPYIVLIMMGEGFSGAILPLQLMVWTMIPFSIGTLSEVMLTSLRKQRVMITSYGLFFAVSLTLGLLLIPQYKAMGASITLVIAILVQFASVYYYVTKEIGYVSLFRPGLRPFVSMSAMLAFFVVIEGYIHPIIAIPVGLMLYCYLLYALKTFDAQEIGEIVLMVQRRRARPPRLRDGERLHDGEFHRNAHSHSKTVIVKAFVRDFIHILYWGPIRIVAGKLPINWLYKLSARLASQLFILVGPARIDTCRKFCLICGHKFNEQQIHTIALEGLRLAIINKLERLIMSSFTLKKVNRMVTIEGLEHVDAALAKGRGAIIQVAHFGNFLLPVVTLGLLEYKITQISRETEEKHKHILTPILTRLRHNDDARFPITFFSVKSSLKSIIRLLNNNELIAIAIDGRQAAGLIDVKFLNKDASFAPGIIKFAKLADCPILPTFMVRNPDGTQRLIIEKPFYVSEEANKDETTRRNLERLLVVTEKYVRNYPSHFFMNFRRNSKINITNPIFTDFDSDH